MARPATAPPRGFTPQDLERLPRKQRLQLGRMLVTEWGLQIVELDTRADYDDLVVEVEPFLCPRLARVRLAYRTPSRDDLAVLAELARNDGLADFLLIAMSEDGNDAPSGDHYVPARALIELLEGSALVRWAGGVPEAARHEFAWLQAHQAQLLTADTVGLRWLPILALNKIPWPLRGLGGSADDWFERIFFRLMTGRLRLRGCRLGSASRGQRLPDGLLLPLSGSTGIIYDCKAARDGYTMTADHERRLIEYGQRSYELDNTPVSVSMIAVVSSLFPAEHGREHPFYARRRAVKNKCGLDLAYLCAADLADLVMQLDALDSTAAVDRIDWSRALSAGVVQLKDLLNAAGVV
jgi:hypothetical protein